MARDTLEPAAGERGPSAPQAAPPALDRRGGVAGFLGPACFWIYLTALTVATHVPRVSPSSLEMVEKVSPLQPDKTMHLVAYGVLGALAGAAFATRMSPAAIVRLFVALACWGFVDELTQPLFGRGADIWDWCYDVLGLAIGLSSAVALGRWWAAGRRAAGSSAAMARSAP